MTKTNIEEIDLITIVAIATETYIDVMNNAKMGTQVVDFAFDIQEAIPTYLHEFNELKTKLENEGHEIEENTFMRYFFEKLVFNKFKLTEKIDSKGKMMKPFYKLSDCRF